MGLVEIVLTEYECNVM